MKLNHTIVTFGSMAEQPHSPSRRAFVLGSLGMLSALYLTRHADALGISPNRPILQPPDYRLKRLITSDFQSGRTIIVQGWVLSKTEVEAYLLDVLSSEEARCS